jgi:hypothetical protein
VLALSFLAQLVVENDSSDVERRRLERVAGQRVTVLVMKKTNETDDGLVCSGAGGFPFFRRSKPNAWPSDISFSSKKRSSADPANSRTEVSTTSRISDASATNICTRERLQDPSRKEGWQ